MIINLFCSDKISKVLFDFNYTFLVAALPANI